MIKRAFGRATIQLFRNKRTSFSGILLMFLLLTSYSAFSYYDSISQVYRVFIEERYPSEVLFRKTNDDRTDKVISDSFISDVLNVPHVRDYNRSSILNAQLITDNPVSFTVQTDINTSLNPYFKSGQLELLGGHYPDAEQGGVLVEADYFGITSEPSSPEVLRFEIETPDENLYIDLPIVGIYRSVYPIERMINGVPVKQNIVFINEKSIADLSPQILDRENVTFILDDHSSLDETMVELDKLNYDHDEYGFFPSLSLDVATLLNSIRVGEASRKMIMVIFRIISTGMLCAYLVNDYLKFHNNMVIYSLLGEKKQCIILEYCLRILELFGVSFILSMLIFPFLQPVVASKLMNNITQPVTEGSFSTTFELQRELLQHNYTFAFSWKEPMFAALYIFIVLVFFLIIVGIISFRRLRRCGRTVY